MQKTKIFINSFLKWFTAARLEITNGSRASACLWEIKHYRVVNVTDTAKTASC